MVKSGGINIAPAEVEEVLMRHTAVRTAYVIGVPHATLDEALVAIVVSEVGKNRAARNSRHTAARNGRLQGAVPLPLRY